MGTSFGVRFQKTYVYKGTQTTTYWVRWTVAGEPFKEPFRHSALADSFRSGLVSAARNGEGFDTVTGRPVSSFREIPDMPWYEFACKYVDMKWPEAAATSRRGIAESLTTATCALLASSRGKPGDKVMRSALFNWAFNTTHRASDRMPAHIRDTLKWIERNTRNVSTLAEPEVLRPVLNALARKVDGKQPVAATVANRKRAVLFNALEYAGELKLLPKNPIVDLKWTAPKVDHAIDPRVAVNPVQARTLLLSVDGIERSGKRLQACYACSYHAGLRPEEAINLKKSNVTLPPQVWNEQAKKWEEDPEAWGEFHLEKTAPHAGSRWTNSGRVRDSRGLKHRSETTTRPVPISPELVAILREHLATFGTDSEGRLFRGERGGEVPVRLYNQVWRRARAATFTPEVAAGPLAATPYDLRHAYVSTLLNAGVEPPRVAEQAGHSLEMLYRVYAKCLHGREAATRQLILAAMR